MAGKIENITILGAGVLGGQIAWHSAYCGKNVVVYDLFEKGLDQCRDAQRGYAAMYEYELKVPGGLLEQTRERLSFTTDLAAAVKEADLVIEAVPEIPEVKDALYREMAPLLQPHTLIATNTSTLLPRDFADATGRPEKFCALHFANHIWHSNLAEIMAHPGTADQTLVDITKFAIEINMVPIPIQKEQNGYVLNTWLTAMLGAAGNLAANGIATPETVDRTYMLANPGAKVGPFGMLDVVGLETSYNIENHWAEVTGDPDMRKRADFIKQHYIDQGKLGVKTGEGFYKYPNPAYQDPDFLRVPDISRAEEIAMMAKLRD